MTTRRSDGLILITISGSGWVPLRVSIVVVLLRSSRCGACVHRVCNTTTQCLLLCSHGMRSVSTHSLHCHALCHHESRPPEPVTIYSSRWFRGHDLEMPYPRSVGPRSVMGWIGVTTTTSTFTDVMSSSAIPAVVPPWDAQMYSAVVGDVLFVSQELETLSRWCPWSWIPHPGTQFRTTILGLKMSYPRSVGPRSVMGWIGVTDSADVFTNVIPYPAIPVAMAPWGYGMQLRYRWRRTAEIL